MKIGLLILILLAAPAQAQLATVPTAAGPITIAGHLAGRMQALISDLVARGFKGPVHCHARSGHVRRSRHYAGAACDFAQRGWGRTVGVMYRSDDLIRKHGFRSGCDFRDCGHVDDGATRAYRGLRQRSTRHHRYPHASRHRVSSR